MVFTHQAPQQAPRSTLSYALHMSRYLPGIPKTKPSTVSPIWSKTFVGWSHATHVAFAATIMQTRRALSDAFTQMHGCFPVTSPFNEKMRAALKALEQLESVADKAWHMQHLTPKTKSPYYAPPPRPSQRPRG